MTGFHMALFRWFIICVILFGVFTLGYIVGYKDCSRDVKDYLNVKRKKRQTQNNISEI